MKNGVVGLVDFFSNGISFVDMMIGNIGGCIGEILVILLLLGGVYLMYKGIINYVILVFYIVIVFILIFFLGGFNIIFVIY